MTVNVAKLEKLLLGVIVRRGSDDWLALSIGDLRNRIVELDKTMSELIGRELMDCMCDLSRHGQVMVQKFTGVEFVPLDDVQCRDDNYLRGFFGRGDFQMRLTHEGRKKVEQC